MKYVLALFIFLGGMANAEEKITPANIAPARVMTQKDMEQPPVSAVAFTQCNMLIALYATLQSGDFVKADVAHHPKVDLDTLFRWGDKALAGAERVEADCDDPAKIAT